MRSLFLLLAGFVIVTPLAAQSAANEAAKTITAQDMTRHIAVIAADTMMGRDTPSPGLEMTAQYVASEFKKYGLKPGGDRGSWLQRYPFSQDSAGPPATAPNVIGILEGSDPKLKSEFIVVSAHMDNLSDPEDLFRSTMDTILNGADDNASGTAGVLELAEAFSRPGARPRRSLVFLTVSGQQGRLQTPPRQGSTYFANHSPVSADQIVAVINLDMIGRNWTDQIAAVGKAHSDLGTTLGRVAADHPELGMAVLEDSVWPRFQTSMPKAEFFHLAYPFFFDVPGLTFFNDYHLDYRKDSDEPHLIDADKASRVVRLAFYFAQAVGNADKRAAWTEAGNQFRTALKDSLPKR